MKLYSGRDVTLSEGAPAFSDIARALSRIPRFAGHTREYFTVLTHSFACYELGAPFAKLNLLIHDVGESVINDIPTPFKHSMMTVREENILGRFCEEHGIAWGWSQLEWDEVNRVDKMVLHAEAFVLGYPDAANIFPAPDPVAVDVVQRFLPMADYYRSDPEAALDMFRLVFDNAMRLYKAPRGMS